MAKIKVHEIAKEFEIKSSDVIAALAEMGIEGKAPASGLEDDTAEALRKKLSKKSEPAKETAAPKSTEEKSTEDKSPVKKMVKKAGPAGTAPAGQTPVKKKKPIIVVSSARNGHTAAFQPKSLPTSALNGT